MQSQIRVVGVDRGVVEGGDAGAHCDHLDAARLVGSDESGQLLGDVRTLEPDGAGLEARPELRARKPGVEYYARRRDVGNTYC